MKLIRQFIAAAVAAMLAGSAGATATPEEFKELGMTLTPWGAEKAGNEEGTIPAYTGGLTLTPAGISVTSDGKLPNPFASEKPLFSIAAKNVEKYADKLTRSGQLMGVQEGFSLPDYNTGTWLRSSVFTSYDLPKAQYAAVNLIGIMDGGFYRQLPQRRPERGADARIAGHVRLALMS